MNNGKHLLVVSFSVFGTKRTSRDVHYTAAIGGGHRAHAAAVDGGEAVAFDRETELA
jgi:hypothetical protein